MKKIFLLAALLLVGLPAHSQTRFLTGIAGAGGYSNSSFGLTVAAEVPFKKRYEFDLMDTFSPVESHVAFGFGTANTLRATGLVWVTPSIGVMGAGEYSSYNVARLGKGADYTFVGPIFRLQFLGMPTRMYLNYIRQIGNGIINGVESSHLQGGLFGLTTRLGCTGSVCFRIGQELSFGHILTQGNPVCDGSTAIQKGVIPCPRRAAMGGGVTAWFTVEFPRRRDTENEVF